MKMKSKIIVSSLIIAAILLLTAPRIVGLDNRIGPVLPTQAIVDALDRLYDAIVGLSESPQPPQKEGFCEYFEIPRDSDEALFTVPEGKKFVLRKIYIYHESRDYGSEYTDWVLTVDDSVLFNGTMSVNEAPYIESHIKYKEKYSFVHDFPDECVVIESGQTLKALNLDLSYAFSLHITVIGYFCGAN